MHRSIIAASIKDRESFNIIDSVVEEKDFSDRTWIIFKEVRAFYTTDEQATHVDVDTLCAGFKRNYEKHAETFIEYVTSLPDVSLANVKKELLSLKEQAAGTRLANSLLVKDGKSEQMLQDYIDIRSMTEEDIAQDMISPGLEEIMGGFSDEAQVKLHPKVLNDRVGGGIPRGSNMLVFAPPECGKTLFNVNLACGFLQDGKKVVYIGNEESHRLVLMRFYNRLTGMTKEQIIEDPQRAEIVAMENGYENLVFAPLSPGTLSDVRRLVDKYEPDIVFVDQLRNLDAPMSNAVEKMDYLTTGMRNLVKQYDIVGVSVVQGADTAQNKLVLDLGDVYFSKVAAQGNVDLMIGIGMNAEYEMTGRRMISICKNKFNGNHAPFIVNINPYLSTME